MAKPLNPRYNHLLSSLFFLSISLSLHPSIQFQHFYESQSLLKIQRLLFYPSILRSFNSTTDFCNIEPTPSLNVVCYQGNVTQLHIIGNNGVPPLPQNFSTLSFFSTIATLSSLKVLSLVSLGLWGPLPAAIGRLSSLEILNLSSNYFTGEIPVELSSLVNLQTLILDHNKFTGPVPGWLSSLPLLAVLSLKNNSLSGSLPNSITSLENLRVLSLAKNHLFGEVPDLHNLTNLQVLDLEDNYLGPHFPSLHKKLVMVLLRNNSFQYGIPAEPDFYYQLQKLDISLNGFVGRFPPSLLSLPSINYLDISQNKFTGMLFENMSCNGELAYVDLSSNRLSGELPSCLELNNPTSRNRVVLYSGNCFSNKEQEQNPSNWCHNEALAVKIIPPKHKNPNHRAVVASSTMGGTVGGIAVVGLVVLFIRKRTIVYNITKDAVRKPQTKLIMENASTVNTVKLLSDARYISQTMRLGASLPAYRTFALEELRDATSNFDASNLLCQGSQSQTYKGKLSDGTPVTIRILRVRKKHSKQQTLMHHIELISKLRHRNLASSLGHCLDDDDGDDNFNVSTRRIFLVFEFVPNGTLRDYISGAATEKNLSLTQKIGAAIEVARGIQFLHTGIVPGLFSNNLKITDVLLDHHLHVKISVYNLPLLLLFQESAAVSYSSVNWTIRGTNEEKNDVYDLGVILLEIITGRPILQQNEIIASKHQLQLASTTVDHTARSTVDPTLDSDKDKEHYLSDESLKIVKEICNTCLSDEPTERPSVEDVLWNLQFAAQILHSRNNNQQESQSTL